MLKYWFKLSDKIRFFIIGGFNAGVSYLIYSMFVFFCGSEKYQSALALAWVISSITSFLTQKYFVFNIGGNFLKQYFKCCTTWVISYVINAGILEVFVQKFGLNVYLSQIIATLLSAISTYILFKKFAFKK